MEFMHVTAAQLEQFTLVLIRVSAIVISMPVVGNQAIPARVKAGFALMIAVIVAPVVVVPDSMESVQTIPLMIRMAGELIIGFIIGISAQFLFAAVQLAGQLIGFQMGFAIVNVVDPLSSAQVSVIAQFLFFVALLLFLAVDAHHIFIYGIVESFRVVPIMTFQVSGALTEAIMNHAKTIFATGLTIGAPVMVLVLLSNVGLGLVARTVPQINIFIVGFPLKIGIGLIAIGITLPFMGHVIATSFTAFSSILRGLLEAM